MKNQDLGSPLDGKIKERFMDRDNYGASMTY